jgi:peptidoglycan/LPS O-acetylase OafA/YrhL
MNSKPNLDLLRSIAVTFVVVEHTLLTMRIHWIGNWNIAWLGVVGVFMFFVHTSLVLMWSLERKPHIVDFYIRRIFRIYPLAIVAVLVTVLFHIPTLQNPDGDTFFKTYGTMNIFTNILLIQNLVWHGDILGVMWTLPNEVDMYFLLPFLFFFVRKNFVILPLLSLWIATVAYDRGNLNPLQDNTFINCIPYFLSGVISYVLFSKLRPRLPAFLLPLLIAVLLCCFMPAPSFRKGWWLTLALGVALPLFHPIRAKWLIRTSHELAKYSYGIYLSHSFAIVIGVKLLHGYNVGVQVAAIILSIAAIVIPAYHFLEKPMIDLGAKIAARIEQGYEEKHASVDPSNIPT